jgi:hypothetical protein
MIKIISYFLLATTLNLSSLQAAAEQDSPCCGAGSCSMSEEELLNGRRSIGTSTDGLATVALGVQGFISRLSISGYDVLTCFSFQENRDLPIHSYEPILAEARIVITKATSHLHKPQEVLQHCSLFFETLVINCIEACHRLVLDELALRLLSRHAVIQVIEELIKISNRVDE